MTTQEKNLKIAEACGWRHCAIAISQGFPPNRAWRINGHEGVASLPDCFDDLNAMHDAEQDAFQSDAVLWHRYAATLDEDYINHPYTIGATAAQRAEAFGIVMGLWKKGE